MTTNEQEFKAMVKSWGRKEMLKMLRAWGFTCHKIKSDDELAHALWLLKKRSEC